LKHLIETAKGLLNEFPQWRVNFIDRNANRHAPHLVELAFHNRVQTRIKQKHLELRLLSCAASLSKENMERLIDYAEHLQGED